MLPRAVSHCHGNRGQRQAPQCPPMSLRLSGMSMTYGHKQHLVTQTFMATADVGGSLWGIQASRGCVKQKQSAKPRVKKFTQIFTLKWQLFGKKKGNTE